jgi:hypothetical protein
MQKYSRWKVWFWWVLATTIPGIVGLVVSDSLVVGMPAYAFVDDNAIYPLSIWSCGLLLVAAPSVAIAQALVFRRFTGLRMTGVWVRNTMFGVFAAMLATVVVAEVGCMSGGLIVPGTVIGFAQWLVLRRYVERAGWWVLACTIGWNAGLISGWAVSTSLLPANRLVFPFYPTESALYWVIPWFLGLAMFAAITGFTLKSLSPRLETPLPGKTRG